MRRQPGVCSSSIAAKMGSQLRIVHAGPYLGHSLTDAAAAIRAAILQGCPGAQEIGDRAEAIETAMRGLAAGDVLVVAGKGHETGQIVGDRVIPFSDHDAVAAAARKIGGGA